MIVMDSKEPYFVTVEDLNIGGSETKTNDTNAQHR